MPKICLVGAGSTVFAQNILGDVLSTPSGQDYVISLFDIDAERLKTSEIVARRICEALSLTSVRIEGTLNRRDALKGADFVILMMQVGGYRPATVTDFGRRQACLERAGEQERRREYGDKNPKVRDLGQDDETVDEADYDPVDRADQRGARRPAAKKPIGR